MGTPMFAVPSLEAIVQAGHHVSLVVTSPDKPRRRKSDVPQPTPIKEAALRLELNVLEVENIKDDGFHNTIKDYKPDVIVVVAFRILPKSIFSIPKIGIFNLHASLLPKYRGAAPIQWAIMNGDTTTGVTTFFIEDKVDTGNILLQEQTDIGINETGDELEERLSHIGANLAVQTLSNIQEGNVTPLKQDSTQVTVAPKLTIENTCINWNQSAESVHNFIRALSRKYAAWTLFDGKRVKIYQSAIVFAETNEQAGLWKFEKNKLFVTCKIGAIEILELQIEGKKNMKSQDFLNGYRSKDK